MDRIEAMKIFIDVSQTLSLTKTASNLKLTRSFVTRSINELEKWLDSKLLQRTTRSILFTHDGELFLEHCKHVVEYVDNVMSVQKKKNKDISGTITITSSIAFSQHFLSPIIAKFNETYPDLVVNLIADDNTLDLRGNRIDLAIRITNSPDSNLIGRELCNFPVLLVASPGYLIKNKKVSNPSDIINQSCVVYSGLQPKRWVFSVDGDASIICPNPSFVSNESGTLLSYTLAGGSLALLPGFLVEKYIKTGQLVRVLPEWNISSLSVYALYLSGRKTHPAIKIMSDYIAAELKKR